MSGISPFGMAVLVTCAFLAAWAVFAAAAVLTGRHRKRPVPLRLRLRWWWRCHGTQIRQHENAASPAAGEIAAVMRAYRRDAGPDALGAEETTRFYASRALSGTEDA